MTKGKKRVAKKDKTDDQKNIEIELNAISSESFEALKILHTDVIGQDIHLLWPEQKIDEEFVKCLLKTGFDLLEHA